MNRSISAGSSALNTSSQARHSARFASTTAGSASAPGAAHDVPLPYAPTLEDFVLPQTDDLVVAARWLAAY